MKLDFDVFFERRNIEVLVDELSVYERINGVHSPVVFSVDYTGFNFSIGQVEVFE